MKYVIYFAIDIVVVLHQFDEKASVRMETRYDVIAFGVAVSGWPAIVVYDIIAAFNNKAE